MAGGRGGTGPVLTRAGGVQPLLAFLEDIGASVPRLLRAANVPPELFDEPYALVPLTLVRRFVETCATSQGIENLGAIVAQRSSALDLAVLGPALRRAVTVHDYLQIGCRAIREMTSGERIWLTLERDSIRFHHTAPGRPCPASCQEDIYLILLTIRMLREFVGSDWSPREVTLVAPEARLVGDLAVFGDAELRLGEQHSSFTMPFEMLHQPIRSCQAGGGPAAQRKRESPASMPHTFLDRIEALVGSMLTVGGLDIRTVAEAADLSPRTLQRLLQQYGSSYSDVVRRLRIRLAKDRLANTDIPVSEIAAELGYTDATNFCRAFRRGAGISPRLYRRSH